MELRGDDDHNDIIRGTRYDDKIYGFGGADYIGAGGGNDSAYGGWGNDYIHGGPGSDHLFGEGNNDLLQGGFNQDFLFGGSGSDHFLFRRGDTGHSTNLRNTDVIEDFNRHDGDKIDLSLTSVSYFVGSDTTPELNEVSYWRYNNETVVSFNDRGQIHDILLDDFSQNMISTDFIV